MGLSLNSPKPVVTPYSLGAADFASHAARKLRTVLSNVQSVLAIELLTAAQAVEWRAVFQYDPNRHAPSLLEAEHAEVQARQFEEAVKDRAANIATQLGQGTRELYLRLREVAQPVFYDRPLDDDIRAARRVIL